MIVVDASAIVDVLIAAESEGLSRLRSVLAADDLVAPALLDYEVVSTLKRVTLAGKLSRAAAMDALMEFDDLPIARWNFFGGFRLRAFELSQALGAYDAAYVVLAEALDVPLITRDRKLADAADALITVEVI